MAPKPDLFSPSVGCCPVIVKLPKFPIGESTVLAGVVPHGEAGPLLRALPAVLLRIKPPNGKAIFVVTFPAGVSSERSSDPEVPYKLSLTSVGLRVKKADGSSRLNRLVPPGDANEEYATGSPGSRRRVLGRVDVGEVKPKPLPPP